MLSDYVCDYFFMLPSKIVSRLKECHCHLCTIFEKLPKVFLRCTKILQYSKTIFKVSKIIFKDKREFNIIIKNYFLRANSRSKVRQKFKDDKCTGNSLSTIWKWMRFPCHIFGKQSKIEMSDILAIFLHYSVAHKR